MSYQGHPFTEDNASRSINKYICCLVKGITSGGDTKYDKIQSRPLEEFSKDIMKRMDHILDVDANLRLRVEANKDKLKAEAVKPIEKKLKRVFPGYRPSPEIFKSKDYNSRHTLAVALRNMNGMIRKSKHLKISNGNVPQLMNACCLEKLDDIQSYYDFFGTDNPLKGVKPSSKNIVALNKVFYSATKSASRPVSTYTMKPIYQTIKPAILYERQEEHRSFEDVIKTATDIQDLSDESVWDDIIFPKTLEMFDIVKRFIEKAYDGCEQSILDSFRPILIMITEIGDADTVRQCIYNHLTITLPREVSKIANKKIDDDDWRFSMVTRGDLDISKWTNVLMKDVGSLWLENDVTKNISILSFMYVKIMYDILMITAAPDAKSEAELFMALLSSSEEKKGMISLVSRFVFENIKALLDCIRTNDVDVSSVRQKVEELRELRKQELINMYKIDDEERQLQMTLRKIGVDTWYDVGEVAEQDTYIDITQPDPKNISITKHANALQENENYNMKAYLGENTEANEVDEDFVSAYTFSPEI
jgi:hypothetical protein